MALQQVRGCESVGVPRLKIPYYIKEETVIYGMALERKTHIVEIGDPDENEAWCHCGEWRYRTILGPPARRYDLMAATHRHQADVAQQVAMALVVREEQEAQVRG